MNQRLDAHVAADCVAAARHLAQGGLVVLPTETVYGLAADADQPAAVRRIFVAKGRPADHPLIVHVAVQPNMTAWKTLLQRYAHDIPDMAWTLIERFWPGPLTLVLKRNPGMAEAAAGGLPTLALRSPAQVSAQKVLAIARTMGVEGVAAPSANRFGRVSPTRVEHAWAEFEGIQGVGSILMLDDGLCDVGIESTIVDLSRGVPVLLRPGMLSRHEIEAALGVSLAMPDAQAPRVSGSLESHYAPSAKVRLLTANQVADALLQIKDEPSKNVAVYARQGVLTQAVASQLKSLGCPSLIMPDRAAECAHELFDVLRRLDALGVKEIWVEAPPPDQEWDGVRDRLNRAAA